MPIKNTMGLKEKIAKRYGGILTARPYNRFEPENTTWWLVPTTDWPAYRLPKILISKEKNDENLYHIGLYAEKGHGHVVAEIDNSKKIKSLIMDKLWFWNKFCEEIKDNNSKLNKMLEKMSDYKMYADIKLSYINYNRAESTETGVPLPDFKAGEVKFLISGRNIELIFNKPNPENQDITKLIETISKCKNLSEVVDCINNFDKIAWAWCDFAIWTELTSTISEDDMVKVENKIVDPVAEYIQQVK